MRGWGMGGGQLLWSNTGPVLGTIPYNRQRRTCDRHTPNVISNEVEKEAITAEQHGLCHGLRGELGGHGAQVGEAERSYTGPGTVLKLLAPKGNLAAACFLAKKEPLQFSTEWQPEGNRSHLAYEELLHKEQPLIENERGYTGTG
eukprot:1161080-Pelagomonas_calceolata.AAC.10